MKHFFKQFIQSNDSKNKIIFKNEQEWSSHSSREINFCSSSCFWYIWYIYKQLTKTIMKPNYSSNGQSTSPHYVNPALKHNSPNIQPRLSHNAAYTNSSKDISVKKEDFKDHKFLNTYSPNYATGNKKFNDCSPFKPEASSKPTPAFI